MALAPRKGIASESLPDHGQSPGEIGMAKLLTVALLVRNMLI